MRLSRRGWAAALAIIDLSFALVAAQGFGVGPRVLTPSLIEPAAAGLLLILLLVGAIQLTLWVRARPPSPPTTQTTSQTSAPAPTEADARDPMVNIRLLVRYLDPLRAWLPLLAAMFGFLYAIGFLVVNSYLGQYGVRELEPVRARYAAAAPVFALFVFAVVSVLGGFGRGRLMWRWNPPEKRWRRLGIWVLWALVAFVGLIVAEDEFLGRFGYTSTDADIWKKYRDLGLVDFTIGTAYLIARGTKRWDWQQVLAVVGSALVALTSYATNVYTRVPAWAGGGHPDSVQLVFIGEPPPECLPCRDRVDLIDADDFRVIVLIDRDGQQDAVELARSTIRLIVHLHPARNK